MVYFLRIIGLTLIIQTAISNTVFASDSTTTPLSTSKIAPYCVSKYTDVMTLPSRLGSGEWVISSNSLTTPKYGGVLCPGQYTVRTACAVYALDDCEDGCWYRAALRTNYISETIVTPSSAISCPAGLPGEQKLCGDRSYMQLYFPDLNIDVRTIYRYLVVFWADGNSGLLNCTMTATQTKAY
ncbi:MAG: hypothetical protein ACD_45C00625G0003 [uncultured bacterium]|nr:MAG: hypothetical protein ACD_45C00625G0003 [uncultured bacterium]